MINTLNKRQADQLSPESRVVLGSKGLTAIQKMRENESIPKVVSKKLGVKKMLSDLQGKFSHSPDIEALIESKVKLRTEELYRKANYDALTHLPNRGYFHETLEKLVQNFSETDQPFSLLFLDLDGFKKVNDILGHHIGDELLRHISARLISSVREGDIVSRLGGDEFVILLANTDAKEVIEAICKRIIQETSRLYWFDGKEVNTSVSIGISSFPKDARTASELVENADEALYSSKLKGKKTYSFFEETKSKDLTRSYLLQSRFEKAIKNSELEIYVEPQVDLKQNIVVGGSMTIHWKNSESETPFLTGWSEILKKSGEEHSIALWLLDSGCYYLHQWCQYNQELVVSIPILESLWRSNDFISILVDRLQKYQVAASQIQLEFSLKEFVNYDAFFQNILKDLHLKGFQITLTGMGAVPLDLSIMAGLSIQKFKLDPNWLNKHIQTSSGRQWIQGIIQMSKSLDACVIAPGVSSHKVAELLTNIGCDLAQGDFWSAPVKVENYQLNCTPQIPT